MRSLPGTLPRRLRTACALTRATPRLVVMWNGGTCGLGFAHVIQGVATENQASQEDLGRVLTDGSLNDEDLPAPLEMGGAPRVSMPPSLPEPKLCHKIAARCLTDFVLQISYLAVETAGTQNFATPVNKCMTKEIYESVQHLRRGPDQGNRVYGQVYQVWAADFSASHPGVEINHGASTRGSSPAGNILETYKYLAETVRDFNKNDGLCRMLIEAAKEHLEAVTGHQVPHRHTAIYARGKNPYYGFSGCALWVRDLPTAKQSAVNMLEALSRCALDSEGGAWRVAKNVYKVVPEFDS